jgi:hypothetical protein
VPGPCTHKLEPGTAIASFYLNHQAHVCDKKSSPTLFKMFDFSNFDQVFGSLEPFPYKRSFIQEAEANRRGFEGALFIDRVLAALGHAKGRNLTVSCCQSPLNSLADMLGTSGEELPP